MSDSGSEGSTEQYQDYMDDLNQFTPPSTTEEHLWIGTLTQENKLYKFEGCDDADSTLLLKRATLDAACEDTTRHVVQIISLDHTDKRIDGTLCSLKLDSNCSISLDSIGVSPPAAFKLLSGNGPLTLVGNLIKTIDTDLEPESDEEEDKIMESPESPEKVEDKGVNGHGKEKAKMSTDSSSEEEDSEKEEEVKVEKVEKIEEEKVVVKKDKKKEKIKRKSSETNESPAKKPKTDEPKAKVESEKPAKKAITTADELIDAIKAYKGGRPKKKEKFENWIKHTFKVDNKGYVKKAWKEFN